MKQRAIPTLADVAREAKVSTATVSRCLNAPDRVVEKTRKRVLAAVQQLGYSPNFGARALAARRTGTIGAVIPTMDNAIFARGLQAFQEVVSENGATLLLASAAYDPELEEQQIRSLVARGADALLLIGEDRQPGLYAFLDQHRIPYVLAWSFREAAPHCCVGFDNRAAAREMTERVLGLGHRRIGMIAGITQHNDRARDRVSGVTDALRQAGMPNDALQICEAGYSFDEGAQAAATLLARTPHPTILICGNDVLAAGALREAKARGRRIPEDLSVTGFDDIALCEVLEPGLTTVHVPHREMGQTAARCLFAALSGDGPMESQRLSTTIVLRQSLAAPAIR